MDIENASGHVTEQAPNPRTRVQSLLNTIEGCTYPKICARVSAVLNEANGMHTGFKLAIFHILPACNVADKVAKKRKNAQISGLGGNFKAGTGPKTGVELCYHNPPEFAQPSDAQRDELLELRPPKKVRGKKKLITRNVTGEAGTTHMSERSPGNRKSKGKFHLP